MKDFSLDIQLKAVLSVVTTVALTGNANKEKYAHLYIFLQTNSKYVCDVRYNVHIKTMFGSSLPPAVCRRARVLFTLFVFARFVFTSSCL